MPELKLTFEQTFTFVEGMAHESDMFDWEGRYTILSLHPHEVNCDHGYHSYTEARTAVRCAGKHADATCNAFFFLLPSGSGSQPWEAVSPHEGDPDLSCTLEYDDETRDVSDVTFRLGDRTLLTIERGFWTDEGGI